MSRPIPLKPPIVGCHCGSHSPEVRWDGFGFALRSDPGGGYVSLCEARVKLVIFPFWIWVLQRLL